jgi:integrase
MIRNYFAALLPACEEINPTLHLVTIFALSTGARKGEIQKLRWPNVNLKMGQATLLGTKNEDTRTVPLTGYLLDLLKAYKKKNVVNLHSDLVFPSPRDPSKVWEFRSDFDKAIAQAEIKDFHFHDTRHCFASYCLASQATLPELMHLMGHKSPAMVAKYAHMVKNHASSIVERMNAKMFGG